MFLGNTMPPTLFDKTTTTPPAALTIIDMQNGTQVSTLPSRNNLGAEYNIVRLQSASREQSQPVICGRHIGSSPNSAFVPRQGGLEFGDRFIPLRYEHAVGKNGLDACINAAPELWLHAHAIRQVVIVAVSNNNSLEATARTAGNLGLPCVVLAEAAFAFDKPNFASTMGSAEDSHPMTLANRHGEYAGWRRPTRSCFGQYVP